MSRSETYVVFIRHTFLNRLVLSDKKLYIETMTGLHLLKSFTCVDKKIHSPGWATLGVPGY